MVCGLEGYDYGFYLGDFRRAGFEFVVSKEVTFYAIWPSDPNKNVLHKVPDEEIFLGIHRLIE